MDTSNWLDAYRTTTQLIADLAWPIVALLLVSGIARTYPTELRSLMQRLLNFKTPAFSADFVPPSQSNAPEEPSTTVAAPAGEATNPGMSELGFWWRCEIVYRTIYGTQIALLRYLNDRVDASQPELEHFHRRHLELTRAAAPDYDYPFDAYVQFLINQDMVASQSIGRYSITDFGRNFLVYLVQMKITEFKSY